MGGIRVLPDHSAEAVQHLAYWFCQFFRVVRVVFQPTAGIPLSRDAQATFFQFCVIVTQGRINADGVRHQLIPHSVDPIRVEPAADYMRQFMVFPDRIGDLRPGVLRLSRLCRGDAAVRSPGEHSVPPLPR